MERSFLELRKHVVPEFVFGMGARHLAGRYAHNLGLHRALVVTDPGVAAAGWIGEITTSLHNKDVRCSVFSSVSPNPRAEEVMCGVAAYADAQCDGLVAVGGGSAMDCAKGIGIAMANHRHVLEFEGVDEVPIPGPPLVCIPTTAGSSADVSQFAIITDETRHTKIAIVSKLVVPDVALIDPVVTTTMSGPLTACTGLDALTHAIEAYVSNASSPMTDLYALEAVRLMTTYLVATIAEPGSLELRGQLMLGSLYAGMAFSNASLGAVHAMAHSLGGLLDVPHGRANALLLEHVIAFNYDAVPERFQAIGTAMGCNMTGQSDEAAKATLLAAIHQLRTDAGVGDTLSSHGLRHEDIPALAERAMADACLVTNPRRATHGDIEAIYAQAF